MSDEEDDEAKEERRKQLAVLEKVCIYACVCTYVCVCVHIHSLVQLYFVYLLCRGMLCSKKESLKQLLSGTVMQWTLILNAVLPANRAMGLLKLKGDLMTRRMREYIGVPTFFLS